MESEHMNQWRDCIRAWYPDFETRTYFLPPVVITRIPFVRVTVAGQSVFVPQMNADQACADPSSSTPGKVKKNDTQDDLAVQRVLRYFRELFSQQSEPMFVISNLDFSSYLGEPCYAAAAKLFARTYTLSKEYQRGDFDILVIHRHKGIITGEIKAVLSDQKADVDLSTKERKERDRLVSLRVSKAIEQLNKSKEVLGEITKDLDCNLAIHKLLILPYVTAEILKQVVSNNEVLQQDLVNCFDAKNLEETLQCCLLNENIFHSGSETVKILQPQTWRSTFGIFKKNNMNSDLYLNLLARFCGPATTHSVYCPTPPRIQIRTEGEGVAVTGERMATLVLTPEQIKLLSEPPTKVLLTGPPGVGKSVMLVLMALTWLKQSHDVHLVSVRIGSLAATHMIKHTLNESMLNDPTEDMGKVYPLEYDFDNKHTDVDEAVNALRTAGGSHGPYVICDEFWIDSFIPLYHRFVTELCTHIPTVCLWVASPFYSQKPRELEEKIMTIPLRCPPAVLNEVQKGVNGASKTIHPYTTTALARPCDGLNVIHLIHHQQSGHKGIWPLECIKCGQLIADILRELRLGMTDTITSGNISSDTKSTTTVNSHTKTAKVKKTTTCPPLQFRDVFVLTRSFDLHDDVKDEAGRVTSLANGFVRGLRYSGTPVHVIRTGHVSRDVKDIAVTNSDVVTVAHYAHVSGLERKVVVCIPGRVPGSDDDWTDEKIETEFRIHAMSRCTAQLVVVDMPMIQSVWRCCVL